MKRYNLERIKVLVTSACNSNCTHCFRSKEKNTEQISFEKLKEIIDFGIDNNCSCYSFSGGEFFTHPNAYDLILYCVSKGVNISILTNALEMDIDFFARMKSKELIAFQVSIDGKPDNHDLRRGKGSYDRTIQNVVELYKLGYKLSEKMVLDENNYRDLEYVLRLPWFSECMVLPVAITGNKNIVFNREYEDTIELVYRRMINVYGDTFHCTGYPHEIAIKYDGRVYPCTEAREHDECLIGNINEQSLRDLLLSYEENDDKWIPCDCIKLPECETCSKSGSCHGGCRLRALRFHGDISKPDPFNCRLFNNAYSDMPIGQLIWGIKTER